MKKVNPITRAAASLIYLLVATFSSSIPLLGLWFICACIALLIFSSITPGRLLLRIAPFAIFGLGFIWINLLFHRGGDAAAGLRAGAVLFTRALVFGALSMLFVQDMNRQILADSLIRFVRLPPRLVYSILIAFRIGMILQDERREIKTAHRLRRCKRTGGLRGRFQAWSAELAALFVAAIRRANRIAVAFEARGLDNGPRTFMNPPRFGIADLVFLAAAAAVMAASLPGRQIF